MSRVVVVVGASSGVGRATARAFAERGDHLVLAARATTTLAEVRAECADVDVLTVPTDVTEPGASQALADAAIGRFGRIDVWVHTARAARAIVDCVDRPRREVSAGRLNVVLRAGFTVLPGVYDVLVGPLMRAMGLSGRSVAAHDGSVFAPNPAGEAVRGGHLPDLRQLLFGPVGAVGTALRRRFG
ncbi:SDR family NAD(P)-dependent oxidoreductase [Micromonospora sp. NPDC049230]|uniref:SDR family NAD(P)-dependent oxidoreductase n=1 Tax=Micromonospora sp. NPDC049230 TaxID=3155502 RepID=UPI0033EF1FC1